MYFREREREREIESVSKDGAEGEGEKVLSRLPAQRGARLGAPSHHPVITT